jgi:NAD(P)-dependent dehydrogenase (short-subunit alcohol dehydrogenase family)
VESWEDSIGVVLRGPWQDAKAYIPRTIEAGNGGSITTSSGNGVKLQPGAVAYTAGHPHHCRR